MATTKVTQSLIADDAIGADQLASNAVVNASIASGASIDMDKLDGDSLGTAITDFAQDDLVILSDTSDSGNLVKITTSNFEDAIFGNISGDVSLAAGGAATLASAQTNIASVLNTSLIVGRDADNDIDFATDNNIIFRAGGEDQLTLVDGALTPSSNAIVDLGTDALEFKDAFFDGTVEADAYTVGGTALNEYIADTIGAMVTSNTETGISVTYEDGDNTLDFVLGTITSLGTISTGVWQGTAIASAYIAGDAVTGAKIADDAIDSEHYTDGSIDNAHIADNQISYEKIDDEFSTVDTLSAAATVDVNFDAAQVFTLTPDQNTTLNITNPKIGITKTVIMTGSGGSRTLAFSVGGSSGTFNKIGGAYDDTSSKKNLISITCVAATEFWYAINQIAS